MISMRIKILALKLIEKKCENTNKTIKLSQNVKSSCRLFLQNILTVIILRDMMYYVRRSMVFMDIQLKKGLLDVCVLAAIKNEDSYGYKIIKDIKPYIDMSESTLYTILKRLEISKMLTIRTAEHGGRLRKYYHITKEGLTRIDEFKKEWCEVMSIYQFVTKEDLANE